MELLSAIMLVSFLPAVTTGVITCVSCHSWENRPIHYVLFGTQQKQKNTPTWQMRPDTASKRASPSAGFQSERDHCAPWPAASRPQNMPASPALGLYYPASR